MKQCNKCLKELPYEDFYQHFVSSDGYSYSCKKCHILAVRANQDKNPGRQSAYFTKYYSNNKERLKEYRKVYYEKNKQKYAEKYKARKLEAKVNEKATE